MRSGECRYIFIFWLWCCGVKPSIVYQISLSFSHIIILWSVLLFLPVVLFHFNFVFLLSVEVVSCHLPDHTCLPSCQREPCIYLLQGIQIKCRMLVQVEVVVVPTAVWQKGNLLPPKVAIRVLMVVIIIIIGWTKKIWPWPWARPRWPH